MRRTILAALLLLLLAAMPITVFLMSCGGGGGSGDASFTASSGTGSVAVFVADGPADQCDAIYFYITEVSLIPAGGGSPVVVFTSKSPHGYKVNILDYRDEDFFFCMEDVPAREYEKIRLKVANIEVIGGPCQELDIKLPSGKIDLNPQGSFKVTHKGCVNIILDFDGNKSFQLKQAGKSGKCIFRPVIFVNIEKGPPAPKCPRVLSGAIKSFILSDDVRIGFVLERDGLPDLRIFFAEDAVILDDFGVFIDASELDIGDLVKVRGKLDGWHKFLASVVVVGEVDMVEGTVQSTVVSEEFSLTPLGQDSEIQVQIFAETLLLFGCDTEVDDTGVIQPGMIVRVVGKDVNGDFSAVLVFLREIVGEVTYFDQDIGELRIQANGVDLDILVPPYTPFYLVGDGDVPPELLCISKQVRVVVDPDYNSHSYDFKAKEVQIQPDQFQGVITNFLPDRVLEVEMEGGISQEVYVPPGATILDLTATEGLPTLFFSELIIGDNLNLLGLYSCDNGDFTGFVVLKIEAPSP